MLVPNTGRAYKHIGILINCRLRSLDLTLKQFILLKFVRNEPLPQSELAIITERDKGSLTRLIQSMERKGLVRKKGSKSDRRVNVIESTLKGKIACKAAWPIVTKTFEELNKGLSQKDQNTVITVMKTLTANAIELTERTKETK